jgi:hypothetical protein
MDKAKDEEIKRLKEENARLKEEISVIKYAVYLCNQAMPMNKK